MDRARIRGHRVIHPAWGPMGDLLKLMRTASYSLACEGPLIIKGANEGDRQRGRTSQTRADGQVRGDRHAKGFGIFIE